jgi:catechol 2,3-dioxygenase-like lactoylglutathione lyase family enzyme
MRSIMWLSKTIIVLRVDDASKSAAFYEALLGGPPAHRSAQSAVFEFDSPPLVLTIEERPGVRRSTVRHPSPARASGPLHEAPFRANAPLALMVAEPQQVGDAAIRLRRAGIRLRVHDEGIEANDPDGNPWRVRFVPSTPGRTVVVT